MISKINLEEDPAEGKRAMFAVHPLRSGLTTTPFACKGGDVSWSEKAEITNF